ncbi:MAG: gamma-glutamyltransferase family protein, partial [Planctomycetota bacterium JB042]
MTPRPSPSRLLLHPLRLLAPVALVAALSGGCATETTRVVVDTDLAAEAGAVVCVEPHAARIGATVLARGGNAVDAAVATAFALAVTWPEAGNLGGGGFLLHRAADGEASFVDYRETAPGAATPDLFLRPDGTVDPIRVRLGYLPVGVPGTVAGLAAAHERFGTIPWAELVAPARRLAEDGILVDAALAESIARAAAELSRCDEASRIFLRPDGAPLGVGDRLVQKDLAASLALVEAQGPRAFYEGEIARRIVDDSTARGGILARADLASYRAVFREPVRGEYRGATVIAGPPPTSGGCVLVESLNQLEGFDPAALGVGSAEELHLLGEVLRRSFLDRARFLGDPDFVSNPLDRILGDAHAASLRAGIDPSRATPSDVLAAGLDGTLPPAEGSTTHFSVVDRHGNAVANTTTLEESWG